MRFDMKHDYKYSRISKLSELRAEKARLHRKIKKQEKRLVRNWKRIEYSWRFFGKIAKIGKRLFSSTLLLENIEMGYKFISRFFSKKKSSHPE